MSIQSLTNSPVQNPARKEARQTGGAGSSFQARLSELAQASGEEKAAAPTLYDAQLAMLERMKLGKEKEEEEEAWEKLMAHVDAWIATLRDEADIEKSARAYAELKALESQRPAKKIELGGVLLEKLSDRILGASED